MCKEAAVKPRVSAIQCNIAEMLKTQIKMNIVWPSLWFWTNWVTTSLKWDLTSKPWKCPLVLFKRWRGDTDVICLTLSLYPNSTLLPRLYSYTDKPEPAFFSRLTFCNISPVLPYLTTRDCVAIVMVISKRINKKSVNRPVKMCMKPCLFL